MGNFVNVVPQEGVVLWSMGCFSSLNQITPGLTVYAPFDGLEQFQANEAIAQQVVTRDGYIDTLRVWASGNTGIDLAVVLRVNGVDTALTATVALGSTTGQDLTNQVTVSAGDLISWRIPTNAMHNAIYLKISADMHASV